jgi:parallel beta-helix repeat protein
MLNLGLIFFFQSSSAVIEEGSQTITGTVTWTNSDVHKVTGNITVKGVLEIDKGTVVQFDGNHTIYVDGVIYINGTNTEQVQLKSFNNNPAPGQWNGIKINSTGRGELKFAVITHAINGIYLDQGINSSITSTIIESCSQSAIICLGTNNTKIANNSISKNVVRGLQLNSSENTSVKFNTIQANREGINITGSKNNLLAYNSLSNRNKNAYDDGNNSNNWISNYYGDYTGIDNDGDYIGDNSDYSILGGNHTDLDPKTKIFNDKNSKTYATISKAVSNSVANQIIAVPAVTPKAGTQTLKQLGYYYDNVIISTSIGHNIIISGISANSVTVDGNSGYGFEVNGNYNLILSGVTIINCNYGIYIHSNADNSTINKVRVRNNLIGGYLDGVEDITIKRSWFEDNRGLAGLFGNNCKRLTLDKNYFNNSRNGLYLSDSNLNEITNNSCNSNERAGIRLNQSKYNVLNQNEMVSTLYTGLILINNSNHNSFFSNDYLNNNNGIKLNYSKYNFFNKSKIKASSNLGISIRGGADDNTFVGISGNDFQGFNIGIRINDSRNIMFRNSTVEHLTSLILWIDHNSSITFLNCKISEGGIAFQDDLSMMTVKYYLMVRVVNKTNAPLIDVAVNIYDNTTQLIAGKLTNINGEVPLVPCVSYIQNQTVKDFSSNNHIITANDTLSEKVGYINVSTTDPKIFVKQFKFNYIPIIRNADNLTAVEKELYSGVYNITNFENNKKLTWSIETNSSSWLQIDEVNQTIFGIPHNRDVGRPWVRLMVRDIDGDLADRNFTLAILNTPPEIITTNQISVYEDDEYFVDYNSTDDDGYYIGTGEFIFPPVNLTTWKHQTNATWLKFDNESGILNGTPQNDHVGTYNVEVSVDDGHGGSNKINFVLTVLNTPPEITSADITTAYKNEEYRSNYTSSDDGQGNITWEFRSNTDWLSMGNSTGVLNGTPALDDVGIWWVEIIVTDDHGGKTIRNFTLTVIDLNKPPSITPMTLPEAYVERLYSVQISATDPDTPIMDLSWKIGPETNASWLTINPQTGILSGTPKLRHLGWGWVNVTVNDSQGGTDFIKLRINVSLLPNTAPQLLTVLDEVTVEAFKLWDIIFEAEDDYTATEDLNWSLKTNADWLIINSSNGQVQGMPQPIHAGRYWVNVSVADEMGLVNFTNFTLIVKHTNKAPKLSNGGLRPLNGTDDTVFTFYVTYTDLDNDSGSVFVIIDNKSYAMKHTDKTYDQGVNYTYQTRLKPGKHTFYFEAKDAWGENAALDSGMPTPQTPFETNHVKEVVTVEFYEDPWFWITILVVIIIILCVVQFVLKPLAKRYPKLEFVNKVTLPDKINPMVIYQKKLEREQSGELGVLCPNCKSVVDEDASKCSECGERFTVIEYLCPHCQAEVKGSDLFCPKCGSKFDELDEEELIEEEPELDDPEEKDLEADEDDSDLVEDEKDEIDEQFEQDDTELDDDDEAEDEEFVEDKDNDIDEDNDDKQVEANDLDDDEPEDLNDSAEVENTKQDN